MKTAQKRACYDGLRRSLVVRSYPSPKVRGGGREEQPDLQGPAAAQVQEGREELLHVPGQGPCLRGATPRPRSGAPPERSNPTSKEQRLRSSGSAMKRDPKSKVEKNPSKTAGVAREHQKADKLKL